MGNVIVNNLSLALEPAKGNAGTAIAGQNKTVSSSSVALVATALNGATDYILWTNHDDAIFVTFDGTAATSSNGHKIAAGVSGEWSKATANAALAIRETTDARFQISEFQTK